MNEREKQEHKSILRIVQGCLVAVVNGVPTISDDFAMPDPAAPNP